MAGFRKVYILEAAQTESRLLAEAISPAVGPISYSCRFVAPLTVLGDAFTRSYALCRRTWWWVCAK